MIYPRGKCSNLIFFWRMENQLHKLQSSAPLNARSQRGDLLKTYILDPSLVGFVRAKKYCTNLLLIQTLIVSFLKAKKTLKKIFCKQEKLKIRTPILIQIISSADPL